MNKKFDDLWKARNALLQVVEGIQEYNNVTGERLSQTKYLAMMDQLYAQMCEEDLQSEKKTIVVRHARCVLLETEVEAETEEEAFQKVLAMPNQIRALYLTNPHTTHDIVDDESVWEIKEEEV